MATPVEMPKLSDTMEEGTLSAWLAEEGDAVSAGDVIAQVETDKATMDLEVYDDGVLLKKLIGEGDAVPIGSLIAVLGEKGEDISSVLADFDAGGDGAAQTSEQEAKAPKASEAEAPDEEDAGERGTQATSGDGATEAAPQPEQAGEKKQVSSSGDGAATEAPSGDGRVKASPLARKLASEHGLEIATVEGSGPEGRIVKRDVEAALEGGQTSTKEAPAKPAPSEGDGAAYGRLAEVASISADDLYEATPISQMRKAISRRLAQSKFTAPHFYLTADIDMEGAVAFRKQLNELAASQERAKISFNDLITKACALALRQHPDVNASYLEKEGEIRRYKPVHVAVAVAIDEGLLTPVIRNADQKGLAQIAEETRELAGRARDRKLDPSEYEGSTFTTSNLGMFGIDEFTAIINPPNACILAIGSIRDTPVVKNGGVVPGKQMKVTLSCDHRVVDGAKGAAFLETVRHFLEEPMNMLL
ncbi:MAG: pyruvate dehydrogenase complex dihydrolipoamide acetyltransferase [Rhodothermales bacterium]